ncbi:conserved hypothetical protein [Vibrio nigripulchritudo SO65]|uniref:hypothetical protein n=1 Tax=Vibrio nigripulchritudo TaxID=28173 RepID=UPI0003B1E805|nr:hypothetical protein [Vibrio nigripulchritudo]CCN38497.1 conserved hypothetical protein [Vibrio nigripulchritudo AM115]CCN42440.1 conserved hypothetical protein [Vibrio nigripulchritudo FTn2]CCN67171.1 conserved hypothetical protein [Vibrio nigripulchritudo POn4]CCN76764.1 conserved hypothetical protein [Vibrio nigripulchritudo SO65]
MNALEHKFNRWKKKRKAGKARYIITWAIIPAFFALLSGYVVPALDETVVVSLDLSVVTGIGFVAGLIFGALSWFVNETWYQNELKKRKED